MPAPRPPATPRNPPTAATGAGGTATAAQRQKVNGRQAGRGSLIELIIRKRFAGHSEFRHTTHGFGASEPQGETGAPPGVDFLFVMGNEPHAPAEVFDRLRWGGQVVIVSRYRRVIEAAAAAYKNWKVGEGFGDRSDRGGGAWVIEQGPAVEYKYPFNLRILGWGTPAHFMVARKVMLVPPGKSSERFTYNVYLEKNKENGKYEVVKEVPTIERVLARLREKFPEADEETLKRRARKFTEKIFPVFLTRETAILRLLQRDLPRKFRNLVPHVISAEVDGIGYTRSLRLNWLRNARMAVNGHAGDAGRPLTQLEFARQSAELLAALHDEVRIMHLDLRLDNVVITEQGVGFVDFGSAVRVGEDFQESSLLSNLFEEMMRTSQIQRMLGKMTQSGQVTSEEIRNSYNRVDKAMDFFYLAVQINAPLSNPDFRGLVEHEPASAEAKELTALTEKILRPEDPGKPQFSSARDILKGVEEIAGRLNPTGR